MEEPLQKKVLLKGESGYDRWDFTRNGTWKRYC